MPLFTARFECEVLTPMFLSGVDQETCELRAASLRGAMRYWYRALLGGRGLSLREVKGAEARVFGEAARDGGVGSSAVSVRVHAPHLTDHIRPANTLPDWDHKTDAEHPRGKLSPNSGTGYLWFSVALGSNFRSYVQPEARFQVVLTSRSEVALREALRAFWLVVHLGGIGTRSRRAAGSIWVRGVLFSKHLSEEFRGPAFIETFDVKTVGRELERMLAEERGTSTPPFDTLKPGRSLIGTRSLPTDSWKKAVQSTGEHLKSFWSTQRAGTRRPSDSDRAGFGLPVTLGSKSRQRELKLDVSPLDPTDRRASPLHISIVPLLGTRGSLGAVYTLMAGPFGPLGTDLLVEYVNADRIDRASMPDGAFVRNYVTTAISETVLS
ncbi:MAG: type III-B CRISPR module RAMP protein Cmr1 [Bacteroidota bacterium]